jgi:hypothetical protein
VFKGNKRLKTILPSKTDLYRAAKRIEAAAGGSILFTIFSTPSGEGIKCNVIHVVRLMIKSYGLEEATKHRPIKIWSSADAATITNSAGALVQGIYVNMLGVEPGTARRRNPDL